MERNILKSIVMVSEKAANIARAIRSEEHLLSLLVREKKGEEKNPKFFQDFKTLADVLVQEIVKNDLGLEYPELIGNIYGEESNEFSCLDGETINLEVSRSEKETFDQLLKIIGDEKVANALASLVHSIPDPPKVEIPNEVPYLPLDELGIWIDPIDSTAEYIAGGKDVSSVEGVYSAGLPCVTVLIGAFHTRSGLPVLGVVNQPFHKFIENRWEGKVIWGVSFGGESLSSLSSPSQSDKKVVVLARFENPEVKSRLTKGGYELVEVAGAGYKLMCVALGLVSAYVLSKPSTFYWDTCGVHAILSSLGGGLVDYSQAVTGEISALTYCGGEGTQQCSNSGGFIAYSHKRVLDDIVILLS